MTIRRVVSAALGLFVVASVIRVFAGGAAGAPAAAEAAGDRVVAYYFHGNRRCTTCNTIEARARETLSAAFPEAWRTGRLEWRTVNMDAPEGAAYRERYDLYSSTLLLSDVEGGEERRWLELDEVWLLVDDEAGFREYVVAQAREYLGEGP